MHVTIGDDAALLHHFPHFTADRAHNRGKRVTETMTQYGFWWSLESDVTGGPSQ
jgi:hypothetical protein